MMICEGNYNIECVKCGRTYKALKSSFNLCDDCFNKFNDDIKYYWLNTDYNMEKIANLLGTNSTRISNSIKKQKLIRYRSVDVLEGEIWKPYHDIYVSNYGRCCKKINRKHYVGFELRPLHDNGNGYVTVRANKHKELVHRVVAKVFVEGFDNSYEVHHIDSDKTNNRLDNLYICKSRSDHCFIHGDDISKARARKILGVNRSTGEVIIYDSATKLSKDFNEFNQSAIQKCCNGIVKHHKGFEWFYISGDWTEKAPNSAHYNRSGLQPLDIIRTYNLNFYMGSALKYICRSDFKNQKVSDIEKAIFYLNEELERIKKEE